MDDEIKSIFKVVGLEINHFDDINGMSISRELLLLDNKYEEVKHFIPELKTKYSSSFMTDKSFFQDYLFKISSFYLYSLPANSKIINKKPYVIEDFE